MKKLSISIFLGLFLSLTTSLFSCDLPLKLFGTIEQIPQEVQELMQGRSYRAGCPVAIDDLRYVTVLHWNYEGMVETGHMVVHYKLAEEIVDIFKELFDEMFPIERMEIVDIYDADDERSMSANNSSCFCCRENTTYPGVYSNHSYGIAIDINPLVNPYVKGERVLPAGGRAYVDRSVDYKGGITDAPENACYRAFTSRGYEWGGSWPDRQDYQHFSKQISDVQ